MNKFFCGEDDRSVVLAVIPFECDSFEITDINGNVRYSAFVPVRKHISGTRMPISQQKSVAAAERRTVPQKSSGVSFPNAQCSRYPDTVTHTK